MRLPRYDPGSGGINVARIAHVLGTLASALFPAGGHAGDTVTALVAESWAAPDAELRSVPPDWQCQCWCASRSKHAPAIRLLGRRCE